MIKGGNHTMKNIYEKPELVITSFESEGIMGTSEISVKLGAQTNFEPKQWSQLNG